MGRAGVLLLGHLHQPVGVGDGGEPAVGKAALGDFLGDGAAVAHVILGHHHKAVVGEEPRQLVIAGGVLRDAVDDLDDAPNLALRDPLAAVDFGVPARREVKFFHKNSFLSILWDRRDCMIGT